MKKLLDTYLFKSSYIQLTLSDFLLTASVILIVLFLAYFIKKLLLNEKLEKYVLKEIRVKIVVFFRIILWVIAISLLIEINTQKFYDYRFFKNKFFEIDTLSILNTVFFITLNLLIIHFFKIIKRRIIFNYEDAERIATRAFRLIQTILWIITVSIVLKAILVNFSKFIEYQLFVVNKIPITVGDLIFALLIMVIGQMILLGLNGFFRLQVSRKKLDLGTSHSIFRILKYLLWIILVAIVLESAGFKLSILLAGSAALLVGLGFGIQQLFGDFVSGLVIIAESTLKVGDIIDVDGVTGRVIESDLRTTKILTPDNITIILPNSQLTSNKVINNTKSDTTTRFRVPVGVAYGSDVELVEQILMNSALENEDVLKDPAPTVILKNFGESSLDFELLFWSGNGFGVQVVKSNLRKEIYRKFKENGIVIPFPQRDIHIQK